MMLGPIIGQTYCILFKLGCGMLVLQKSRNKESVKIEITYKRRKKKFLKKVATFYATLCSCSDPPTDSSAPQTRDWSTGQNAEAELFATRTLSNKPLKLQLPYEKVDGFHPSSCLSVRSNKEGRGRIL